MAYKALYRKYRPSNFDEVVGQQHIVMTLQNAIKNGKIGHAYLFCGPRGTGKTSIAKLFAKTINCTSDENKPCGKCANCVDIQNSVHPDVVELDAATNNGVDEVRDLIDKVKYAPIEGKYKVYIIDEVHMMTASAFNALLKTLEEPPQYCVFILATTEPHKVLPTIISRCQRFDFYKLPNTLIKGKLRDIAVKENVNIDEDALDLVAELADGGMRDALSILDQCISYSPDRITVKDVGMVYGVATKEEKLSFFDCVLNKNAEKLVETAQKLSERGIDIPRLTMDLINICKESVIFDYSNNPALLTSLKDTEARKLVEDHTVTGLLGYIDSLMDVSNKYRNSLDSLSYFEVALLKMMNYEKSVPEKQVVIEKIIPAKEEKREPESVRVAPVVKEPVAQPKEIRPAVRRIKTLSDDEFYDILLKARKDLKINDADKWTSLLNNQDERYAEAISRIRGASMMADGPEDLIIVVDDPSEVNNINEESSLSLLEEAVEKEFGCHKKVVAVSREQNVYLVNYFRSKKAQPKKESVQEAPKEEKKAEDDLEKKLTELFGEKGYEIVED